MTDQEVEKMLARTLYIVGLDDRARFYACYLWRQDGEAAAENWMRMYQNGGGYSLERPRFMASPGSPEWATHDEANREMERFYREEPAPLRDHRLNLLNFERDAMYYLALEMLRIAGFPAGSPAFAELRNKAVERFKQRDRESYLSYVVSQRDFEKIRSRLETDATPLTAIGRTTAKANETEPNADSAKILDLKIN